MDLPGIRLLPAAVGHRLFGLLAGCFFQSFGAGNIPSFAYMEGKAFRHGDIEDALTELVKKGSGAGGVAALANFIGKGGSKFSGLDIKRVYFGNWLRDYSQAVDIAGLSKLPLQTILNLCMALGFLAHGYATGEFEVTEERLGVYLPTEHIDNPKGYGEGDNPKKYHPKLRGPVDPRELEIDPRTGMKNYIANENGSWDTSKALVRRCLEKCIHHGRQHRSTNRKEDEYEAYRLLGEALHTLEDFSAHSNFCELSLVAQGHHDVFVQVGDQVRIQAPNGKRVAPLVTGTFGSDDFTHSLLGEATDHISEASVSDLNKEMDNARSKSANNARGPGGSSTSPADALRELLFKIPGGGGSDMSRGMEGVEKIRAGEAQGGKKPEDMTPQELHAVLWQVLSFRDGVVKKIENTIEKIPGLGPMIEKLMESISVFVFTTLEPYLKPLLKNATAGLTAASSEVINKHDQFEVFNDPHASDPTHSFLSKDHFNLILNQPAGELAKIILIHTVKLVIKAWDNTSINVHALTEDILQCMFHPDFHNSQSEIQREMLQFMQTWVQGLGNKQNDIIRRLNKSSVRNHENIRLAGQGGPPASTGSYAANQGVEMQHKIGGYMNQIPGVGQAASFFGGGGGNQNQGQRRDVPTPPGGFPSAPAHGQASASAYPGAAAHGSTSGYPGAAAHGHSHSSSQSGGGYPPPTSGHGHSGSQSGFSGQAAGYYGGGNEGSHQAPSLPGPGFGYGPPPGPPSGSVYGPPSGSGYGPPPSFPSSDTNYGGGGGGGYGPPPQFPRSGNSYGPGSGAPGFPGGGGYPAPPQFPPAPGPPGGAYPPYNQQPPGWN